MKDDRETHRADEQEDRKDTALEAEQSSKEASSEDSQVVPVEPAPVRLTEPDASLIARQLMATICVPVGTDHETELKDLHATLALYAAMGPSDAFESALARVAIAVLNGAMDSGARLVKAGDVLPIREVHSKLLMQAGLTLVKLFEAFDRHRRLQQPRKTVHRFSIS